MAIGDDNLLVIRTYPTRCLLYWLLGASLATVVVSNACHAAGGPDFELPRRALTSELAQLLLGAHEPYMELPSGAGWAGVVLSQPGTSLAPLVHAYDVRTGSANLLQFLANNATFDRPMAERLGLAYLSDRPLSAVWDDFIKRLMPEALISAQRRPGGGAARWLYSPRDEVDRARGLADILEPSEYMLKYREYEGLYALVAPGAGEQAWRVHPRLAGYPSLSAARAAVVADWVRFGYKREIESALRELDRSTKSDAWYEWVAARAAFDYNREPVDSNLSLPLTLLVPGPAAWFDVSNWVHATSTDFSNNIEIAYELARVRILRPWMDVEILSSDALSLDSADPRNSKYVLSDGTPPTFERSPAGALAMYADELILVRNIRPSSEPPSTGAITHPLLLFAYRDAINLLGFVVRALPKYPR